MEKLLDIIENEIRQRNDYLHHLRFGNRIVFKSNTNEIHWIIIDSYTIGENSDAGKPIFGNFSKNRPVSD